MFSSKSHKIDVSAFSVVYGHLQQIHLQRLSLYGPTKFKPFAAKPLAAKPLAALPLTAGHLQRVTCSKIGHLQKK